MDFMDMRESLSATGGLAMNAIESFIETRPAAGKVGLTISLVKVTHQPSNMACTGKPKTCVNRVEDIDGVSGGSWDDSRVVSRGSSTSENRCPDD